MATYLSLAKVTGHTIQNVQELAAVWGDVASEVNQFDATLRDSYAVLGDYDFVLVFEAPDHDTAFKVALTMERHGLDMQTMEIIPTERFAELVEDI